MMKATPEISFHHLAKNPAVESLIHEKIDHLEQFCDRITTCHVVVERPNKHEHSGNPHRVRLQLHVPPGHDVVAVSGGEENGLHDSLETVVIDAFDKAERQLKKLVSRPRSHAKAERARLDAEAPGLFA